MTVPRNRCCPLSFAFAWLYGVFNVSHWLNRVVVFYTKSLVDFQMLRRFSALLGSTFFSFGSHFYYLLLWWGPFSLAASRGSFSGSLPYCFSGRPSGLSIHVTSILPCSMDAIFWRLYPPPFFLIKIKIKKKRAKTIKVPRAFSIVHSSDQLGVCMCYSTNYSFLLNYYLDALRVF
jgi:hypothetical protein